MRRHRLHPVRPRPQRGALINPLHPRTATVLRLSAAVGSLAIAVLSSEGPARATTPAVRAVPVHLSAAATTHQVMIMGYKFAPASLTVNVGDTVVWTNMDTAPHDATSTSGPDSFSGPTLSQGGTQTWVATKPGTYTYICSVHPDMTATMTVEAVPAVAKAPAVTPAKPKASAAAQAPVVTVPKATTPKATVPQKATTPVTAPAAPAAAPTVITTTKTTVDPLLLVAAVVAAAVVFCLLMLVRRKPVTDPLSDLPPGWVVVPAEPDREMARAGR